ncbi:unnamed protein product (macronuclear) [Paramecium tetraurelia]|uniref:TLDc domain-containing protein n=1 Tax=Paramecium tetraurelia TaxID=5888 RepID=A0CCR9_PARTE|nr:uncharacterized protein GSPATT00037371001 [Paramecium tetraurelia]CAK68586.1 unnamed protein product [Paramecium tetraurelia]|eukprot:XP_001435983.1 hypothetical protein (macronuclear) [Paramecium tetraurelia strain d4-2]
MVKNHQLTPYGNKAQTDGQEHQLTPYGNNTQKDGQEHQLTPYENNTQTDGQEHQLTPYGNKAQTDGQEYQLTPNENNTQTDGQEHQLTPYGNNTQKDGSEHQLTPYGNNTQKDDQEPEHTQIEDLIKFQDQKQQNFTDIQEPNSQIETQILQNFSQNQSSSHSYSNQVELNINYSITPNQLVGRIHQNLQMTNFNSFKLIYNENFEKFVNQNILQDLFYTIYNYGSDPLICIAAEDSNTIVLVACDYSTQVFQETKNLYLAQCSHTSEICWYYYINKAFGFSPYKKINLNGCDSFDPEDPKRLCISINTEHNGRRIGILNQSEQLTKYNLLIYILNI